MDLDQHIADEARRDHFRRIDRGRGGLVKYGRFGERLTASKPTRMFPTPLVPASMAPALHTPLQSVFSEGHPGGFTAGVHDLRSTRSVADVDLDILCGRAIAPATSVAPVLERAPRRVSFDATLGKWVTVYL